MLSYILFLKCLAFSLLVFTNVSEGLKTYSKEEVLKLRDEVKEMFYHAYDSYLKYAYPYDELRPISCDGVDTYGSYSLTLIDALDTLAIMGNYTEFQRVVDILTTKENFDANINVSVFETNIRIIGGLLSAHLMSHRAGVKLEPGWPCNGPLLRLAEDVAKRLIVAFDTPTGMPYGTVNLRHGVPKGETTVTCTAGIGTFIVEFGTLSRLTGDPLYEEVAMNALYSLFNHRSQIGLFGNHIDVATGRWTAQDAGIGSGIDSYFEYLVKGAILLQKPELMEMFHEVRKGIDKYFKQGDWYFWVSMTKGQVTLPVFQSLEAYWPGVLSLLGETNSAMKTLHNYHQVWLQYGFTPEFYNIPQSEAGTNRENYPLRPELIESIMYLYRSTGDPYLLQMGVDILRSIQHSAKTSCGYATIKDVRDHRKEDRMESFFLAETTKYLYLLFDTENFIHNQGEKGTVIKTPNGECIVETGGYIFNTEAHPVDPSALHCCYDVPKQKLYDFSKLNEMKHLFRGDSFKKVQATKTNKFDEYEENIATNIPPLVKVQEPPQTPQVQVQDQEIQNQNQNNKPAVVPNPGPGPITRDDVKGVFLDDNDVLSQITTESSMKLDDNESYISRSTDVNYSEETVASLAASVELVDHLNNSPSSSEAIMNNETFVKDFDPQAMLERIRSRNKYPQNKSWESNYKLLTCKAQPFIQKLSIFGEFFNR